ncbi:juvenile hormone esterase-like [Bombus pyrosoma]|uniref:juvenile hormone esterase-like n=1 Tax=Bombus pyrosoma TaxID=396416 RepID=UPI001CB986CD|nr:juvenile hormone esterase-like [Bombus pyrosoma]
MAHDNTVVRVKQGQLRGVIEESHYGDRYLSFRGIPYAKPPVGPLRFKDPEPIEPWTGVRDALEFGNCCSQKDMLSHDFVGDDDCLYLNVYRPMKPTSTKMSVMVWIHGGAFMMGSGNDEYYGPVYFMRKDVILVTINYRLGVLGFLNLEHEVAPGNQGLKDQVMALKWVQENICNFGGDPNNVTIFGESAGASSVHYLTLSPLAHGLFHKAIIQSGAALNPWAIISEKPSKYGFDLAAKLGETSKDPETVVEFLRTIDAKKLVDIETKLLTPKKRYTTFGMFVPGVDDKSANPFMPQHPAVRAKAGIQVPLLIGFNSNEGSMLLNIFRGTDSAESIREVNENFELVIPEETKIYLSKEGISSNEVKHLYLGDDVLSEKTAHKYANYLSDVMFLQGIHEVVNVQMETNNHSTYFYKFTYDPEQSIMKATFNITLPGATHAEELQYLFYANLGKKMGIEPFKVGSEMYRMMECFTQMWTDFAKTGNPTPKTTELIPTTWQPVIQGDKYIYMNINKTLKMESCSKEGQRFDWKKIKNKL